MLDNKYKNKVEKQLNLLSRVISISVLWNPPPMCEGILSHIDPTHLLLEYFYLSNGVSFP